MRSAVEHRTKSDAKIKELILHVAWACATDEKFGAVKLNKILFYADFLSYLSRGESITGQQYFALEEGPAPQRLLPIREEMVSTRDIAIQPKDYYGYQQDRVFPLRKPNYKILTGDDVAIVDDVIKKLKDMNADEVSRKSHKFVGYQIAYAKAPKTVIPYSIARFDLEAFDIAAPQLPQNLVSHAYKLAKKIASPSKAPVQP